MHRCDAQKALSKKQKISGNGKKQREAKKRKGEKRKERREKENGGSRGCPPLRCRYKLSKRKNKKTCNERKNKSDLNAYKLPIKLLSHTRPGRTYVYFMNSTEMN